MAVMHVYARRMNHLYKALELARSRTVKSLLSSGRRSDDKISIERHRHLDEDQGGARREN